MLPITQLQNHLPWGEYTYSAEFNQAQMRHKHFGHALLHVLKAAGKLAAVVDNAEHSGSEFTPEEVDRFLADLVICAARMANTCPGRRIDLDAAVISRCEDIAGRLVDGNGTTWATVDVSGR